MSFSCVRKKKLLFKIFKIFSKMIIVFLKKYNYRKKKRYVDVKKYQNKLRALDKMFVLNPEKQVFEQTCYRSCGIIIFFFFQ